MSTLYDNLPLPVFLAISFLIPISLIIYFWINRNLYPNAMLIGILFVCLTGLSSGFIRLFKYLYWTQVVPASFALIAGQFIFIGAYQKAKGNEEKRKHVLFLMICFWLIILVVVLIIVLKYLGVFEVSTAIK